jgi:transcriptional regulator with PAS, ATPase and Fis domain
MLVRELRNAIERANVLVRAARRWTRQTSIWQVARRLRTTLCRARVGNDLPTDIAKLERAIIREALDYRGGSKAEAAGGLHVHRQPRCEGVRKPDTGCRKRRQMSVEAWPEYGVISEY